MIERNRSDHEWRLQQAVEATAALERRRYEAEAAQLAVMQERDRQYCYKGAATQQDRGRVPEIPEELSSSDYDSVVEERVVSRWTQVVCTANDLPAEERRQLPHEVEMADL